MTHLVYVGSIVPDEELYWNAAFSRAGNMAQEGLIEALVQIDPDMSILSFPPLPVFPKGQGIVSRSKCVTIHNLNYILIPYLNLPIIKYPNISMGLLSATLRLIRNAPKKDVYLISYNFNSFIAIPLMAARLLGRLWGKKVRLVPILFDVDVPGHTVQATAFRRLDYSIFSHLIHGVDGMIAITEGIVRDFSDGKPSLIVEGGVKTETIERFYALRRSNEAGFHVLLAGALERYNGVDVLLEAMQYLPDPDIKLLIAGKGHLSAQVEAAAKRDPRICYLGYLSHEELAELYDKADVLVNHRSHRRIDSNYVFPSKLLEYLLTGVPTISTRFASLPSEYEQHLHLVEGESAEELAAAIMEVRQAGRGQTRDDRNRAASDFIRREKSWVGWSGKIESFLRSL